MISFVFKNCFNVLKKKPIRLWGLSLLVSLLTIIAVFATWTLPILFVPIVLVLKAGMSLVYLDGYRSKEVNSDQIFAGFKKFAHVAGGMAWMTLWILIWGLIPICGFVFAVIKAYAYRFTPYILMTQPEVSATEALRLSMQKTEGYKGTMFLADLIVYAIYLGASIILGILMFVPFMGFLFGFLSVILHIAGAIFLPLFTGLVNAAFYDEIIKLPPRPKFDPAQYQQNQASAQQPVQPQAAPQNDNNTPDSFFCEKCGAQLKPDAQFCPQCGAKLK